MEKKLLILGLIPLIFCAFLSGCTETTTNPETSKFLGTWIYSDNQDGTTIKFLSDGTFLYGLAGHTGTWTVQDGTLQLNSDGESAIQTYSFSSDNTVLTLGLRDAFGFLSGNYTKQ